jgi:TP901 family phage tail tape measure protein
MGRNPKAEVEVTASSKTLGAKLREARAKFGAFGAELKKNVFGKDLMEKGFWGKGGAQLMGNLSTSAVQGGASVLEDQAKAVYSFEDQLNRLQIAIRKTPEEMDVMRKSIRDVSTETGLGADTVLRAARAYVDLAGAGAYSTDTMRTIARAAQASGSDVGDLATVVYSLHNALKVPDNEMEATLSGLINQSKDGTIHFQKMGAEIIAIAPQFARFGVLGREGTNQLGAMFQVIGGGSKDAAETGVRMNAIFRGLQLHAKLFRKGGVQVFDVGPDGVKRFRSIATIFDEIGKSKLMKDPTLMIKAFGRGDGEAATHLIMTNIDKMHELEAAARQNGTIQEDLAARQASSAGRIELAMNKMKNAIADAFTPGRIAGFVNAVERLADKIAPIVDGIGKIGSVLGEGFHEGQVMRKWLGGDGKKTFSSEDMQLANGGYKFGADNSTDAMRMRMQGARSRMADVGAWNSSVDTIMGGERGGKSTPESIERAIMAVYSTKAYGKGRSGEVEAGGTYLTNAGVDVNKYVQGQLEGALGASGQAVGKDLVQQLNKLGVAIERLASAGTTVAVDGNAVVHAVQHARVINTRPRG